MGPDSLVHLKNMMKQVRVLTLLKCYGLKSLGRERRFVWAPGWSMTSQLMDSIHPAYVPQLGGMGGLPGGLGGLGGLAGMGAAPATAAGDDDGKLHIKLVSSRAHTIAARERHANRVHRPDAWRSVCRLAYTLSLLHVPTLWHSPRCNSVHSLPPQLKE